MRLRTADKPGKSGRVRRPRRPHVIVDTRRDHCLDTGCYIEYVHVAVRSDGMLGGVREPQQIGAWRPLRLSQLDTRAGRKPVLFEAVGPDYPQPRVTTAGIGMWNADKSDPVAVGRPRREEGPNIDRPFRPDPCHGAGCDLDHEEPLVFLVRAALRGKGDEPTVR